MFQPYISGLTAVSSFRALDASAEVAANQLRAKRSWDLVFDRIFLFGSYDKRLDSPTTQFLPCDDYPSISLMTLVASYQEWPVCLINADIVVAQNLKEMVNRGWARHAVALTSKRLEFDPATEDYFRARVVDYGCDFFCAMPYVWRQVYKSIPSAYRIGAGGWDNWMLGYLSITFQSRFLDISTLGPIFHPKHGSRIRPPTGEAPADKYITSGLGFPAALT